MRIAFVVNNYPPKTGGVETHVHSLAVRLRALGHDVIVVTLGSAPGPSSEDGVQIIRMREHLRIGGVLGFPAPGATRRIVRLLKEHQVEIVSVHTRFFPMTWIGLRAARRTAAAVVHTEHGSDHVVSSSWLISAASRLVDKSLGRYVLRNADEVLGVSESVTAFIGRLSGRSARVFYNAIDASAPSAEDARDAVDDRLVFVGRLVPGKGVDIFIDVVEATGLAAVILGDGPERAAVEERIRRAGLVDRVRVRGRVSQDEVRRELTRAILVNPTTLAEGFQTTLLEALDVYGRVASFDVPGADLLAREGYPVIVSDASVAGLVEAVARLREEGVTAKPLEGWYWDDRAREYESIMAESLRRVSNRTGR